MLWNLFNPQTPKNFKQWEVLARWGVEAFGLPPLTSLIVISDGSICTLLSVYNSFQSKYAISTYIILIALLGQLVTWLMGGGGGQGSKGHLDSIVSKLLQPLFKLNNNNNLYLPLL